MDHSESQSEVIPSLSCSGVCFKMILNNLNLDFIRIVADILDLIVAMPATADLFSL